MVWNRPDLLTLIGREDWIWTSDPSVPNAVLYQTEPLPDTTCIFKSRTLKCQSILGKGIFEYYSLLPAGADRDDINGGFHQFLDAFEIIAGVFG